MALSTSSLFYRQTSYLGFIPRVQWETGLNLFKTGPFGISESVSVLTQPKSDSGVMFPRTAISDGLQTSLAAENRYGLRIRIVGF